MKPTSSSQTTMNADRGKIAQVVLALLFCVVIAALGIRHLVLGMFPRVLPVTVLIALGCFVLVAKFKEMLIKLGLALVGTQALVRFILDQVHASYALRHLAAIGGQTLMIVGLVMLSVAIVQWLRFAVRSTPTADPEDVAS
jgi:hypothetical protein